MVSSIRLFSVCTWGGSAPSAAEVHNTSAIRFSLMECDESLSGCRADVDSDLQGFDAAQRGTGTRPEARCIPTGFDSVARKVADVLCRGARSKVLSTVRTFEFVTTRLAFRDCYGVILTSGS